MCSVHLNLEFPFPVAQNRKKEKKIPKVLKNKNKNKMHLFFCTGKEQQNSYDFVTTQFLMYVALKLKTKHNKYAFML